MASSMILWVKTRTNITANIFFNYWFMREGKIGGISWALYYVLLTAILDWKYEPAIFLLPRPDRLFFGLDVREPTLAIVSFTPSAQTDRVRVKLQMFPYCRPLMKTPGSVAVSRGFCWALIAFIKHYRISCTVVNLLNFPSFHANTTRNPLNEYLLRSQRSLFVHPSVRVRSPGGPWSFFRRGLFAQSGSHLLKCHLWSLCPNTPCKLYT